MTNRPPFDFDMRVAADKKRRKAGRPGLASRAQATDRVCDFQGCQQPGEFRAPRSPERLDEYFWFCKDHIREYNLKWNYFQGTTDEEFRAFLERDRVWGRATQPFGTGKPDEGRAWARMGVTDPMGLLGERATRNPAAAPARKLPPAERKALEILDARDTWTRTEIRKQYKSLVKDLHPDMNGGDRRDEDRLQEVVWAWDQLKDSRFFKD